MKTTMTVTFTEQGRWEVLAKDMRSPSGSVRPRQRLLQARRQTPGASLPGSSGAAVQLQSPGSR